MTLYQIIFALQHTQGKNAKRALLAEFKDNHLLMEYLRAVYDPRLNYYITKVPKVGDGIIQRQFCTEDVWDMESVLANRQVTGKAAAAWLKAKMECLNPEGRELVEYIIKRDIRAGIAETSILSVWPDLFFIPPYQRCASMDSDLKERFGQMPFFYVQTKSDGQFCYAIRPAVGFHEREPSEAMSRAGSLYPDWVANTITAGMPAGYVAMGELLVERNGKVLDRKTGNGILNSILSGDGSKFDNLNDAVKFLAWDLVTEAEFRAGKSDRKYSERWADIINRTCLRTIPHWQVHNVKDANMLHAAHIARGEEGTVWKNPEMLWRDCSSGDKDMMKAKVVFEADYKITGAYEGEGKAAGSLGGFNLASSDGLIEFNCGSGFSEDQRLKFWKMLQIDNECFNGLVVTAEGNDIVTSKSKPGKESVFLPIFIEYRLDKKEADSRARVWEQFNAAKEGRAL